MITRSVEMQKRTDSQRNGFKKSTGLTAYVQQDSMAPKQQTSDCDSNCPHVTVARPIITGASTLHSC